MKEGLFACAAIDRLQKFIQMALHQSARYNFFHGAARAASMQRRRYHTLYDIAHRHDRVESRAEFLPPFSPSNFKVK